MKAPRVDQIWQARLKEQDLDLPYWAVDVGATRLCYAATNRISEKRVRSLCDKEPTTVAWLESFHRDDVFYDVGANVGTYTVWAAVRRGCRVYAFEPEALNYAELNKNIYLNKLHGRVLAYNVAMSGRSGADVLYLNSFTPASSHHDAGHDWRKGGPRLRQGCVLLTIDDFAAQCGVRPTHIKIDVDGLEATVFHGLRTVLDDPGLETVLIEIDHSIKDNVALIDVMLRLGWKFSEHQVTVANRFKQTYAEYLAERAAGKGGRNVIFYRDDKYDTLFEEFKGCYNA